MAKHIGIVACSAEGAALCYRTICLEGQKTMGAQMHPEVTMHTFPLGEYMNRLLQSGNWAGVAELMLSSAAKLTKAGADFLICPDNTIHQALDLVLPNSPLPWLHIAEEVSKQAQSRGYRKLGVLGTKYLMTGPVYPSKVKGFKLESMIPDEPTRERINDIIFNELVEGKFTDDSRRYFGEVIDWLKQAGCDAVVLGCTEIPLLVEQQHSSLPILDSTRILARAALAKATEKSAVFAGR
jgi:aspartate racemase